MQAYRDTAIQSSRRDAEACCGNVCNKQCALSVITSDFDFDIKDDILGYSDPVKNIEYYVNSIQ